MYSFKLDMVASVGPVRRSNERVIILGTSARRYILENRSYSSFETIGYTERKRTSLDKRYRDHGAGAWPVSVMGYPKT